MFILFGLWFGLVWACARVLAACLVFVAGGLGFGFAVVCLGVLICFVVVGFGLSVTVVLQFLIVAW